MKEKDHAIFLLGEDIIDFRFQLAKPQTYWTQGKGKKVLRIWLLAKVPKAVALALTELPPPDMSNDLEITRWQGWHRRHF